MNRHPDKWKVSFDGGEPQFTYSWTSEEPYRIGRRMADEAGHEIKGWNVHEVPEGQGSYKGILVQKLQPVPHELTLVAHGFVPHTAFEERPRKWDHGKWQFDCTDPERAILTIVDTHDDVIEIHAFQDDGSDLDHVLTKYGLRPYHGPAMG
jgi:hypothetical protein